MGQIAGWGAVAEPCAAIGSGCGKGDGIVWIAQCRGNETEAEGAEQSLIWQRVRDVRCISPELQATPEAWSRFTAAVGDAPAYAAAAGATNRAAFLAAARVCRADVERLFEKVPRA